MKRAVDRKRSAARFLKVEDNVLEPMTSTMPLYERLDEKTAKDGADRDGPADLARILHSAIIKPL